MVLRNSNYFMSAHILRRDAGVGFSFISLCFTSPADQTLVTYWSCPMNSITQRDPFSSPTNWRVWGQDKEYVVGAKWELLMRPLSDWWYWWWPLTDSTRTDDRKWGGGRRGQWPDWNQGCLDYIGNPGLKCGYLFQMNTDWPFYSTGGQTEPSFIKEMQHL